MTPMSQPSEYALSISGDQSLLSKIQKFGTRFTLIVAFSKRPFYLARVMLQA